MSEPLENMYFNWLSAKVLRLENPTPSLTYDTLLKTLHNTEFVWLVQGDDNRAEDGLDLRTEFTLVADIPDDPEWRSIGCSILEFMIAFSRRAEFVTDISAQDWFWHFVENLGLDGFNDATNPHPGEIKDILEKFVWRTYNFNGNGGLFPIHRPSHDQTKVEIWYQFCEYLVDQEQYQ